MDFGIDVLIYRFVRNMADCFFFHSSRYLLGRPTLLEMSDDIGTNGVVFEPTIPSSMFSVFQSSNVGNPWTIAVSRGGLFLCNSLDTDDGLRPIASAIVLIEAFCQSNSWIFSRSSIVKCLYFIHFYFTEVLHLLVELTRPPVLSRPSFAVAKLGRDSADGNRAAFLEEESAPCLPAGRRRILIFRLNPPGRGPGGERFQKKISHKKRARRQIQ